MRKIVAISVNTTPKRWVSGTSRRAGDQLYAYLTDNKHEAQDFGSDGYAQAVIDRLLNPHERKFKIENISVKQPARVQGSEEGMI